MAKDWIGNARSTYVTLGSSSHSAHDREDNDYYATDPITIDELLSVEQFSDYIWEPACGEGHMSKKLVEHGKNVISSDLIDRGFGVTIDFLSNNEKFNGDIITNPPYKFAKEFVEHSLDLINDGRKVAMFLKLTFLESSGRLELFRNTPPKTVYVYSSRRKCAMNGEFDKTGSSAAAYAWFVWEKGFHGDPIIKWIK